MKGVSTKIMIVLSVIELIVDVDINKTYRVLWIDSSYVIAYVIDINASTALPFIMTTKEIEKQIKLASYTIQYEIANACMDKTVLIIFG